MSPAQRIVVDKLPDPLSRCLVAGDVLSGSGRLASSIGVLGRMLPSEDAIDEVFTVSASWTDGVADQSWPGGVSVQPGLGFPRLPDGMWPGSAA